MTTFKTLIFILTLTLFTSCEFIIDTLSFKDKTQEFIETMQKRDYDKCLSLMALEHETAKNVNLDTLKSDLALFRDLVEQNFGNQPFSYTLMKSEKIGKTESTPPHTTLALIEFSNDTYFGVLQVLFDDKSKKILNIKTLDIKAPKPYMLIFKLSVVIPLMVLLFNIFVIRQIKRSTLRKKWLKYLAVLFFNVPAISYSAMEGLSFEPLSFQLLFGVSFNAMGYLGTVWTFGIPLGGLYWLWKLKQHKQKEWQQTAMQALTIEQELVNEENNEEQTNEN